MTFVTTFAVAAILCGVLAMIRWNAYRQAAGQGGAAGEGPTTTDLLNELKSGRRAKGEVIRDLSHKPEGIGLLRLLARDETVATEVRAHAAARLLLAYPDFSPNSVYTLAEQFLDDEDAEVRLAVASGLPSWPPSAQSVPLLARVIDDPDPRVRMHAAIKLLSIDAPRHEHWDYAFRQLLILLQSLPDNPSIDDKEVRCGLYRLSVTAADMTPVLDTMLENTALRPSHREMAAGWREFVRDRKPNTAAPPEFCEGCL